MAKIIAICNQKGGVGKTVTTVNLGIGLARQGNRVLLVDVDAQGSLTASLGYQHPDQLDETLSTVLGKVIEDKPLLPSEGIIHQKEGVDLLPANIDLAAMEVTLVNIMSRETVLREYLNTIRDQYDVILLDCCPSLGMLTINALSAADTVIIPMMAHYLSLKGMEQLMRTIGRVKRQINQNLIGNHESVHIVVLRQVGVGLLEFPDLLGVKHMDLAPEPAKSAVFPESVYKIISVDAGGLHADHDLFQTHCSECRHNFIYKYFSTLTVVLYSEITVLFPIWPHEVDCVSTAAHINANE